MKIIDGHIHIFSDINGSNLYGIVKGCDYGRTINAGQISPFMPPITEKTAFTKKMLLEMMAQNGVEKAVIFQNPTIGSVNDEVGAALLENPEKFAGVLQVDPYDENAVSQAELLLKKYPFSGIKFEVSTRWGWTGIHSGKEFHYNMLEPLLDLAEQYHLTVVFDTGDTNSRAYLPEELDSIAKKYGGVTFVVEHGGYLTPDGDEKKWEQMTDIAKRPNVYVGICAIPVLYESEYPCKEGNAILKRLYEKVGADKLIWGTDAPCTLKNYTYRQMIDSVSVHADFLEQEQLEKIFFSNAQKVYFCK